MSQKIHLVSFLEDGQRGFQLGRRLTPKEAGDHFRDVLHLSEYWRARDLLPLVDHNGKEAIELAQAVEGRSYEGMLSPETRRLFTLDVNRTLINFLASVRLFLDHNETRIKRRYGARSSQLAAFKGATAAAYDAHASYRVLYHMRNYVQHCGMPVDDLQVRARMSEDATSVVKEVAVEYDANLLLDRFEDWKHAKPDLEVRRPVFRIMPLVAEMIEDIEAVDRAVLEAELEALAAAADRVLTVYREAAAGRTEGGVANVVTGPDGRQTQFGFRAPPDAVLRVLGRDPSIIGRPVG